jgi:hypothetical protein
MLDGARPRLRVFYLPPAIRSKIVEAIGFREIETTERG